MALNPTLTLILVVLVATRLQFVIGSAQEDKSVDDARPGVKQGQYAAINNPFVASFRPAPQEIYFPQAPWDMGAITENSVSSGASSRSRKMIWLVLLISQMINRAAATESTTTSISGTCSWSPWSSCSKVCRGTRSRTRTCLGKTQSESEDCNTEVGFRSDGEWFRASNCYDYLYDTTLFANYADWTKHCEELGARLAATGMRDDAVRTEITSQIYRRYGTSNSAPYIGITDQYQQGVYVWADGYVGEPTFWASGAPFSTTTRFCYSLSSETDPYSLINVNCGNSRGGLCERPAQ